MPIKTTSERKETFESVNKALSDVCELALKQPISGKHFVFMSDAGFRSAGYALMIEANPDQKKSSQNAKRTPQLRLDRKSSHLRNSKCQSTRKNIWQYT